MSDHEVVIGGLNAEMVLKGTLHIPSNSFTLSSFTLVNNGSIGLEGRSALIVSDGSFHQLAHSSLNLKTIGSKVTGVLEIEGSAHIEGTLNVETIGDVLDVRLSIVQADEM